MRKILISIAAVLMSISTAQADEFTVSNIEIPQGGTADLVVNLNNTTNPLCAGFQFELHLPTGVTVATDANSEYVFSEGERMNGKGFTTQISIPDQSDFFKVLSYNGSAKAMNETSGTIITITLAADANLPVGGDPLAASLTECKISNTSNESITLNDEIAFSITIGEPSDGRVLLDETSTTAPDAATDVDVRVIRSIKANDWNTICLPFAMTTEQVKVAFGNDVQLADFNDYEFDDVEGTINVKFTDVIAIEANHPYIIKVSQGVTEFTVDDVDIDPQEAIVDFDTSRRKNQPRQMVGTYVANTPLNWGTLFLSGNKFWYSIGDTKMKAFRAYFNFNDLLPDFEDNYDSRITMSFGDETMGIRNANVNVNDNRYYNLNGQRVENSNMKKGLYIRNGRKEIVK